MMGNKECKLPQYDNAEHRCPLAQALQDIHDVAIDYDGYKGNAEYLEKLVDELKAMVATSLRKYRERHE